MACSRLERRRRRGGREKKKKKTDSFFCTTRSVNCLCIDFTIWIHIFCFESPLQGFRCRREEEEEDDDDDDEEEEDKLFVSCCCCCCGKRRCRRCPRNSSSSEPTTFSAVFFSIFFFSFFSPKTRSGCASVLRTNSSRSRAESPEKSRKRYLKVSASSHDGCESSSVAGTTVTSRIPENPPLGTLACLSRATNVFQPCWRHFGSFVALQR